MLYVSVFLYLLVFLLWLLVVGIIGWSFGGTVLHTLNSCTSIDYGIVSDYKICFSICLSLFQFVYRLFVFYAFKLCSVWCVLYVSCWNNFAEFEKKEWFVCFMFKYTISTGLCLFSLILPILSTFVTANSSENMVLLNSAKSFLLGSWSDFSGRL